jgi:hypothetical protein
MPVEEHPGLPCNRPRGTVAVADNDLNALAVAGVRVALVSDMIPSLLWSPLLSFGGPEPARACRCGTSPNGLALHTQPSLPTRLVVSIHPCPPLRGSSERRVSGSLSSLYQSSATQLTTGATSLFRLWNSLRSSRPATPLICGFLSSLRDDRAPRQDLVDR